MTLWDDVRTFHEACSIRLRATSGWVSDQEVDLAMSLVDEELRELADAVAAGDLVEAADALADSLYVLAGFALRLCVARTYINDLLTDPVGVPSWAAFKNIEHLQGLNKRLHDAVDARNLNATDALIHQAMYECQAIGLALRIPMASVWDAVQSSNMAKLVDGQVLRHPVSNKIMKPESWVPPNIAGVLALHGYETAS
ncbi:hypothetical protein [Nocardia brasiliensis]|uniref:hypothetical protein n=1 Tax=Nocardia brasiliensis TaxID=37326 RepID=UPI002458223A|nr:hypothetical protein [Nocardia brasiliensis]